MEGFFKGYKMQNRVVVPNEKHTKTLFKKRWFLKHHNAGKKGQKVIHV